MQISNPVSVVIADDHALFREGVSTYLSRFAKYEVAGHAANGEELIELAARLQPDVVLTDIDMPRMNGIQAAGRLSKEYPDIKILALSFLDNELAVVDMLIAGSMGYLCKNIKPGELEDAIDSVMQNKHYFSSDTNMSLLYQISASGYDPFRSRKTIELSRRELQTIQLVCEDHGSYSIGSILHISPRTVERHLSNIYRKIGVNSVVGLVLYAIRNKLFILPDYSAAERI